MSHTAHTIVRKTVTILHIQLTILALVLLPIAIFTLVTSKTDKIAGIKSFVVLTGSMTPSISQGSVIFTKKADAYYPGDVVSYNVNSQNITHRISTVQELNGDTYFETKGDANNFSDQNLVNISQVVGKSVFYMPYLGKVILFIKTVQGFIGLIIIPSLIFIGLELWTIAAQIDKTAVANAQKRTQLIKNRKFFTGLNSQQVRI